MRHLESQDLNDPFCPETPCSTNPQLVPVLWWSCICVHPKLAKWVQTRAICFVNDAFGWAWVSRASCRHSAFSVVFWDSVRLIGQLLASFIVIGSTTSSERWSCKGGVLPSQEVNVRTVPFSRWHQETLVMRTTGQVDANYEWVPGGNFEMHPKLLNPVLLYAAHRFFRRCDGKFSFSLYCL